MTRAAALLASLALLVSCTAQQQATVTAGLSSTPGQLFCAIHKNGSTIVAPIIQTAATTAGTAAGGAAVGAVAGALAVVVTNQTAAAVQRDCDAAAAATGAQAAIPVSPPASGASAAPVAISK